MLPIPKKNLPLLTGKQFGNVPQKLIVTELHYATLRYLSKLSIIQQIGNHVEMWSESLVKYT